MSHALHVCYGIVRVFAICTSLRVKLLNVVFVVLVDICIFTVRGVSCELRHTLDKMPANVYHCQESCIDICFSQVRVAGFAATRHALDKTKRHERERKCVYLRHYQNDCGTGVI